MRIAQIHWGFPPIIGGVETHLALMLPEIIKASHDVSLLTGAVESEKERYNYHGVEVFRTPLFDLNWLARRGLEALTEDITKVYSDFLESAKPDIIHTHNMHYFSEIHIKILEGIANKKGIPLILTVHNVWDDMLFLKLIREIKWTYMIAVSHYIKKELMGVEIEDDRITVIHHGIDINLFNPKVKPDAILKKHPKLKNKQILFHPARMGMAKGCDTSIKAMNLVKERFPEAMLVLAGTKNIIDWNKAQQKDIAYFVDLVKTFNLEDNIYIDVYSLEEMPELYSLSQVCVYPSSVPEPFGLTMLEALATAKPMVVTNMGGMPEIIQNDIDGYIVPVKDYEALASRIIQLFGDSKLRKRLGNTGRQKVENHYTKKLMTKCHLQLYQKILKGLDDIPSEFIVNGH